MYSWSVCFLVKEVLHRTEVENHIYLLGWTACEQEQIFFHQTYHDQQLLGNCITLIIIVTILSVSIPRRYQFCVFPTMICLIFWISLFQISNTTCFWCQILGHEKDVFLMVGLGFREWSVVFWCKQKGLGGWLQALQLCMYFLFRNPFQEGK